MKRITYLVTAALAAMLILAPAAVAQDVVPGDDDPLAPEQNVVVVEEENLDDITGRPVPQQVPTEHPPVVPHAPESTTGALPKSGGVVAPSILLPAAAALLLGSGVLGYAVLRRRK